jgi:hypothetical protein
MIHYVLWALIGLALIFNLTSSIAQNRKLNIQDTIPEKQLVNRINEIYSIKSEQLIFDLNNIPRAIIENLNIASTPNGLEPRKLDLTRFIANENEPWESTDHIKNGMLPRRKFLFAIEHGTEWVVSYILGGIGPNIIVVHSDSAKNHTINLFVTKNNALIFYDLTSKKKIRKLLSKNLNPIVQEGTICVYNGEFWMWAQPPCNF